MSLQAAEPRVVVDTRVQLGEGSLWDDRAGVLYWVDIAGKALHRFDPSRSSDSHVDIGEQVTTVVPTAQDGQVIVGLENSVAVVDPDTGKRLHSVPLEADFSENRCNDGKCGPRGRFYIGTMSTVRRTGSASLYKVDPDFSVSTCFGGVTVSNGIVWSADERTVYYIDTSTVSIDRIDYDPETGALSNRRPIIEVPSHYGKPDGMTIDREGRLWVAMFHGACVTVWDPQSTELVEKIDIPAKNITSVAFGGEQLSTLYVTTAAIGLNPEDFEHYPASGTLIAVETNTQGLPAYRFGGSAGGDTTASPNASADSSGAPSEESEKKQSPPGSSPERPEENGEDATSQGSAQAPGHRDLDIQDDDEDDEDDDEDDEDDDELPPLPDV